MKIKKDEIIAFGIIFCISLLSYIFFTGGYFSIDTPNILFLGYKDYATNFFASEGRLFSAIFIILGQIIEIKKLYIISLIISLIINSISVILIYKIFDKIFKLDKKTERIITLLLSYSYIFHFMYINNMEFVESCIMSISCIFYISAAYKIVVEEKTILGAILCILAVYMYQGTISIFVITCLLLLLIREENRNNFWKKVVNILSIFIVAIILNFITIYIVRTFVNTIQPERINLNIINNLKINLIKLPMLVINNLRLFPKYLYVIFILILLSIIYVCCIKNKKMKPFFESIVLIFFAYGTCFSMSLIYPTCIFDGNGRIFTAVGSLFSALGIYIMRKN